MREKLQALEGVRARFIGKVVRFDEKPAYKGPPLKTVLLADVRFYDQNEVITDHLWFTCGKWSNGIEPGNTIAFDARITMYEKGYRGYREDVWDTAPPSVDYRLERPTKVVVIEGDNNGQGT